MILYNMDFNVNVIILTWFIVRFKVLTAVSMKGTVFCDVTSCGVAEIYHHVTGTCKSRKS